MWNGFVVMALPKQEGKKIVAIGLWQCHCRNRGGKFVAIVAMSLPKMGGKKKQWLPKSEKELKKKYYIHNIFTTNHM